MVVFINTFKELVKLKIVTDDTTMKTNLNTNSFLKFLTYQNYNFPLRLSADWELFPSQVHIMKKI